MKKLLVVALFFLAHQLLGQNLSNAKSIGANKLWPGGDVGLNVTGNGLSIGIWEAGNGAAVKIPKAFANQITIVDSGVFKSHALAVANVIGNQKKGGIAPKAELYFYNIENRFTEINIAATQQNGATPILVSNHSYSATAGWTKNKITWYGVKEISETEDYKFGKYSNQDDLWDNKYDQVAHKNKYLTLVKAAGNERGKMGKAPYVRWAYNNGNWKTDTVEQKPIPEKNGGNNGFDCIAAGALGKNILTVGACKPIKKGKYPPRPADILLTPTTGFGPADDGRIKPDLVAPSQNTSLATAVVSGTIILLQEAFYKRHKRFMKSATVRALLCHTAFDAETPGPDYKTGWGMVNAEAAGILLKSNPFGEKIIETELKPKQSILYYYFKPNNGSKVRVTLSWTDIAGEPNDLTYTPKDLNNRTPVLVNDLDLRLISIADNAIYKPYILDPNTPAKKATTGDNFVDNLEQVYVEHVPSGWYVIQVNYKDELHENKPQELSLIIDGFLPPHLLALSFISFNL